MKKIFAIISLFIIFLSSTPNTDFTLLDFFDGEYTAYSNTPLAENYINLGTCYMNMGKVEGDLVGESIVVYNLEIAKAIEDLSARVIMTEMLDDGTTVIYCYTDLIDTNVKINNSKVNIQIAHNDQCSVIGWPLILGSF